jgi:hypothetical protein
VRFRPPAQFRGRSSPAERSLDMREAGRAALSAPTIFEGIAQPVRADASHASGRRRKSFCPHHLCPCGVASQHVCLSSRRSPERSRSGTPIFTPPKHFQRCPRSVSESARCNSGWGLQLLEQRSSTAQSNQRSGRRHKPAGPGAAPGTATISPPCSSLRISFVKKSRRSNTGWRIHFI